MANICFNWYINQIPRNLSKSKVNKCKESHTLYANWWKTELKAIGYINPDGQQKNDGCLLIKINKGQKIMKSHGTRKKKSVNLEFYIQKNYSSNMKAKYRHFKTYKNWRKLSPADISYKKKKILQAAENQLQRERFLGFIGIEIWESVNMLENIKNLKYLLILYSYL